MDPVGFRRGRRSRRPLRTGRHGPERSTQSAVTTAHLDVRGWRSRRAGHLGCAGERRRSAGRPPQPRSRRRRQHRLHLRHHRTTQGLPDHPQQPAVHEPDRCRAGLPPTGCGHPHVPSVGARVRPHHRGLHHRPSGRAGEQQQRDDDPAGHAGDPAHLHPGRAADVREDLQHRAVAGGRPGQVAGVRRSRAHGHRLVEGTGHGRTWATADLAARRLRPTGLPPIYWARWAAGAIRQSPAVPRWANDWPTSSAGPGWRCSKATA